ncbi:hypothetical protein H0H92_000517 [Tricholoma furcatifolium]|nr:hypothetical protein H0H92_000517 [Tricholoma furcatifolium]
MRESNFAFPTQNKACVCITSQLYDRRALDTSSPLPLLNSLTHLTYLTSTSPRIREIMTMDGGLERLVRILHDFCICPPPPDNGAVFYGLIPPSMRPPKSTPTLNPATFDKQAAYRFTLAFQCVVNIGVRGSEPIRSRVVQAGTLDVVGCILEAWLANKGFAVGPSSSATGMPRETREQRQARRDAQLQRQREQAAELDRQRNRQPLVHMGPRPPLARLPADDDPRPATRRSQRDSDAGPSQRRRLPESHDTDDDSMDISNVSQSNIQDALLLSASTHGSDTEISTDASAAPTPVGSNTPTGSVVFPSRDRSGTIIARPVWDRRTSPSSPTSSSRPDTETEDDDVDMDRASRAQSSQQNATPPALHRIHPQHRRAVGIVSDDPPADTHIIISESGELAEGGVAVGSVEDGIVSMEANDDFAMGAPPGAPGAIALGLGMEIMESEDERDAGRRRPIVAPDATPRPGMVSLPPDPAPVPQQQERPPTPPPTTATPSPVPPPANPPQTQPAHRHRHHHHHHHDQGPYRDEDVLLSLQLLAYLSKYPHVRQAFYKPRVTFHPASVDVVNGRWSGKSKEDITGRTRAGKEREPKEKESTAGFFRSFGVGARGKEPQKDTITPTATPTKSPRQTNVFSLVERFTFKPSTTEAELPNPPPRLPPEIQYWAGVVMRNACRKDESRGGIRQCANMLCGRWETFPREFAKCRRCRKAKYCGKECQSTAWSEGHRFWCSAKDDDDATAAAAAEAAVGTAAASATPTAPTDTRRERRERERERNRERPMTTEGHTHTMRGQASNTSTGTLRAEPVYPSDTPFAPTASRGANTTLRPAYFSPHQQQDAGTSRAGRIPPTFIPPYEGYADSIDARGRRRAETVTGATIMGGSGGAGGGGGGQPSVMHRLHGPGQHGRLGPPRAFAVGSGAVANPLLQVAGAGTARGEPAGDPDAVEDDNDMVIG